MVEVGPSGSGSAAIVPAATTMQSAAVANGNGTSLPVSGYATAVLQITSSPSMSGGTTVNFEGSADGGTTWVSVVAHLLGTAASQVTTTTADGDYRINVAGLSHLRARISGYSAGTVTVKGYVSPVSAHGTATAATETGANDHTGSGQVSVTTATSTVLLAAAGAGITKRKALIKLPDGVAWYVAYGGAASASSFPVPAGATYVASTLEDIRGYQASGGTVTANVIVEAR